MKHGAACVVTAMVMVAIVTGCSSVKSATSKVTELVGRQKSNTIEPTELQEFEPQISVDDLWSKRVGKGADEHYLKLTPAVLGPHLYVADRYGRLAATDLESGEVIWEVRDKNLQYTGGPGAGDGLALMGTGDARVIAREAGTGKLRWVAKVSSEILAAPQAAVGIVVVRTADGKLYGLNAQSGAQIWIYDRTVPTLTLRGNATPVIHGDVVFAGFDNGRLVALRLATGKLMWESRLAIPSGRSDLERMVDVDGDPIVVGDTVYAASFQGGVAAISVFDGQIEWTRDISTYTDLTVGEERVYITDEYGSWWSYVPHFLHTPGYVYAYSFGELLVLALYRLYQEEGDAFVPKYIDLLAAGDSDYPDRLLASVGVDINDPGFWQKGIDVIEAWVTQAESLSRQLYPEKFA